MARTAKKKIPIYDEGVLLTEDAESLDFVGGAITGTEANEDVAVTSTAIIGVGVAKITVGTTQPVGPAVGDLWVDTN